MSRTLVAFFMMNVSLMVSAQAASRAQETAACKGDALKYCAAAIPDEAKITACMKANVQKLSPACRAIVRPPSGKKRPR